MTIGRRLATLLTVLALVALPAVALRAFCVGKSCETSEAATSAHVPFCPLAAPLRAAIAAGFRQDRSPDAMGVTTASGGGVTSTLGHDVKVPWPSAPSAVDATRVPIAFTGAGFNGTPARGTGLDQIAPTIEEAIGYRRPHPEVRAGTPAAGVARAPSAPVPSPLVVEIAWTGVDSSALEAHPRAWPFLRSLIRSGGTLDGTTGSLPLDPAAILTTIGTGGLPSQHGITGTVLRGDAGTISRAWGAGAPSAVIATLADDLDESTGQAARIGGVLSDPSDRGLIGDGWYLDASDHDDVVVSRRPVGPVEALLDEGYGTDGNPGFIGVVVRDSIAGMDRITSALMASVRRHVPRAAIVVAAVGGGRVPGAVEAADVGAQVDHALGAPIVGADGAGGLFIDRRVSADRSITANAVASAMGGSTRDGSPIFADTFPSFAVAFSRYC